MAWMRDIRFMTGHKTPATLSWDQCPGQTESSLQGRAGRH
ncbi:hypothetical protein Ga0080559_TMP2031 [Salipiger profundus]|uniref:Uncharacterized protein n=1 Tax=Salipiger profundus TaxID=1229727 RepID=A0A1U7D3S7_9RHOB|nr:hypothetical protein Ga0080559_TMP2031 [Salipiger profundus]